MTEPGGAQAGRAEERLGRKAATSVKTVSRNVAVGVMFAIATALVLLDQLTKDLATKQLDEDHPVKLLGGLVYFSLTRNSGAAFSMFRGMTWIFPIIATCVVGVIIYMSRGLRVIPWAVAFGLIMGGALGNLGDRVFRAPGSFQGHVVDFVSLFAPHGEKFAIFNVADMALTFGVIVAVGLELIGRTRDGSPEVRAK